MSDTLAISKVKVNGRHRKDLGDLTSLIESIERDGLFHPIVVTEDGELLAGHRRLEALRSLGRSSVPITCVKTLVDAARRLRIERDENTCRLDMAPSEKARLGMELEKLERPARGGNRTANLPGQPKPENLRLGDTRDVVGQALGWSGFTYDRAKRVIEAADDGDEVAQEALVEMDRTGKVMPAFRRVIGKPPPPPKPFDATKERNRLLADKAKLRVERAVGTCNALARLDDLKIEWAIAVATSDEINGWDDSFREAISGINRLRKRLKESS